VTRPGPRAPAALLLGAALVLAGLGFDSPSALVPGVALILMAVVAVAWVELASRGGRLEREAGPQRVVEDEPYPLSVRLRGTRLPPPGGELIDPLLEEPIAVGPRWGRRLERELHLEGPGRRHLGQLVLSVHDPLGLWSRELRSPRGGELVVLPRIEPVQAAGGDGEGAGQGWGWGDAPHSLAAALAQLEIDGLRPYRDGSPASRIHWPSVARTGELLERRLTGGEGSRPLVVLDLRGERPDAESAMRAAASLCVELGRSGGCELMLPGERRPLVIDPQLRTWPEAYVRIALASPRTPVPLSKAIRVGAVFWVTATEPPRGIARLGSGSYLVSPHPHPRGAPAFTVAGCLGVPLAPARRRPGWSARRRPAPARRTVA
jgi:uncharacterized protein (DUF58 family)